MRQARPRAARRAVTVPSCVLGKLSLGASRTRTSVTTSWRWPPGDVTFMPPPPFFPVYFISDSLYKTNKERENDFPSHGYVKGYAEFSTMFAPVQHCTRQRPIIRSVNAFSECVTQRQLEAKTTELTNACCINANACENGMPTICTMRCASIMIPFRKACEPFLDTNMPDMWGRCDNAHVICIVVLQRHIDRVALLSCCS